MLNSGRSRGGSGEWEQPFWQQRGWILSAGFLLVLLVLAVFTMVTSGDEDPAGASADPSPTSSATPGGGGSGSDTRPAGCRTDDSEQAKPTQAPGDFRWKA